MVELLKDYSIQVDYSVALRARDIAVEMIYGNHDNSFQMLPAYLHMLKECNPGTVNDIQTTHDMRFQFMFVALRVLISAFQVCMSPGYYH